MNVRIVSARERDDLRARFGGALSSADADELRATVRAELLAVPGRVPGGYVRELRAAGAFVVEAGPATLIAVSEAMLAAAEPSAADGPLHAALVDALARAGAVAPLLQLRDRRFDLRDAARVMGIVNVSPESFYDHVSGTDAAVASARTMRAAGATLIDVGGQSYADGSPRVPAELERARVVPAVRAIVEAGIDVAVSVDTFTASVADAALDAGAHLINDCSGLSDPALAERVAAHGAGLVVMHLRGQLNRRDAGGYTYHDALAEIVDFLYERTQKALAAGVARDAIVIDPGLEFGKEPGTDLEILDRFGELRALGYPMLLASSRKRFLGRVLDRPAAELLVGSLASAAIGITAGARLLRVHDVPEHVALARLMAAATPRGRLAWGNSAPSPAV